MDREWQDKHARLGQFLDRHGLDGVFLHRRNNFAWTTGGKDNHIANNSPAGVAAILATRDGKRVCFTNTIESPRFAQEELAGTGIEVVSYRWHDGREATRTLADLIAGRAIAADVNDLGEFNHHGTGLSKLPDDFAPLRWQLTEDELARYRDGAKRTSMAMERACRQVKPGMTEHEIAGVLDHEVHAAGCNPVVTLIATDDRIEKFRHPIPTSAKVKRYAMLVSCAEFAGLISNLTRLVHFGNVPAELARRHQAVCNVDAAVNLSTKPGRMFGEMFDTISRAYADNGFPNEQEHHHQGGSTGYAGREAFAVPGMNLKVLDRQAFAWNPSITGTKSEDTIFCTSTGIEILTAMSHDWTTTTGHFEKQTLDRPGILEA